MSRKRDPKWKYVKLEESWVQQASAKLVLRGHTGPELSNFSFSSEYREICTFIRNLLILILVLRVFIYPVEINLAC